MHHIISWSYGKDSTAVILLFHEHEKELLKEGDKVVIITSDIMFDRHNNIPATNPDEYDFGHYIAAPVFESWGYEVKFLKADKDYLEFFHHRIKKARVHPDHTGKVYGFPANSHLCGIKRDCKCKPIEQYKKQLVKQGIEYIDYLGIAIDEPKRLASMHKNPRTVSLLEKYGYTEAEARALCESYGLLSPLYSQGNLRSGCWFCCNSHTCEHRAIKARYPEAWQQFLELENEPDLAYPHWDCYSDRTLKDLDLAIQQPPKAKKEKYHQYTIDEYFA